MGKQRFLGLKAQGYIHLGGDTFVDGETIVVGTKTYELQASEGDTTPGNVWIDRSTSTAVAIAPKLITAINAHKPTPGVTAVADSKSAVTIRLYADARGAAGNMSVSNTVADAPSCVTGSLISGEAGGTQTEARGEYVVTAVDVLADNVDIETGLTSPRFTQIEIRTTVGVTKAATFEKTITGSKIRLNFAGATDMVAGDVVEWSAWE